MRFKFKPNVNAPRGSSAASVGGSASAGGRVGGGEASEGGEGGGGGGGEVRRKRRRLRSRGDESTGTEGESASELESGETSRPRRRRRKTSEGSSSERGLGQQQSATTDSMSTNATSSQSTKDADSSRTEHTQEPPSTVEELLHTAIDDRTQEDSMCTTTPVPSSEPQVESAPSKDASTREQISISDKSTTEGEAVHGVLRSSAGQTSAGDSHLSSPPAVLLTRGNSVATPGTGKTVPRIKKRVAPKVVSSRPKRTPRSAAVGTGESASEPSSQPSSQELEAETNATERTEDSSLAEREEQSQSKLQEDDSSTPHRTPVASESSSRTGRTQTSNNSGSRSSELSDTIPLTNATPDATISSTLTEVLSNAHNREEGSIGLGNTVPTVFRGVTAHEDRVHVPGDGDTIVVTPEESRHNEVEIRTNDKIMISTAESEESFVVQGCTDTVERTASESPQSTANKTSASTSPSSSQEPQRASSKSTSRRGRGGSAGPRSRRSESTASSVGSEGGGGEGVGEGEKNASRTATKSKRRQKRKKASADSTPSPDEPSSLGTSPSPSPKKPRASSVKVREAPDRSTMTMQELIYYNPSANPMSSSVEEKKRKKEEGSVSGQGSRASSVQPSIGSRAASPANQDGRGGGAVGGASIHDDNDDGDRIVPTLRIGVDGKIVIDENSMMMETTPQEPLEDGGEIVLDSSGYTTSASYRQRAKVARWTKQETTQFFKALRQVGTDFTMMTLLLPKRSRRELKNKFKKEERSNPHLISQALNKT